MALTSDCEVTVVMPPRENDHMAMTLFSSFGRTGEHGINSLFRALNNIDLEQAEATVPDDRVRIIELIREHVGFQAVNTLVRDRLRAW